MNAAPFLPREIEAATGARLMSGTAVPVNGVSTDTRTVQPGQLFVAIKGPRFDGHDFAHEAAAMGAGGLLVHRAVTGISRNVPIWFVGDTLRALGDLALFHRRRFSLPVAAITGSCGKTTVRSMVEHLLSDGWNLLTTPGTQNNQIGVPAALFRLQQSHSAAVLELGTNRWGEIRRLSEICRPSIGIVTMIGPAHLETFGDLNGVLREKSGLWEAMPAGGTVILNGEDPLLRAAARQFSSPKVFWYGFDARCNLWLERPESDAWGTRGLLNGQIELKVPLPGRHNALNALAALACAHLFGMDLKSAAAKIGTIPPVAGRLNRTERDGCLLIDDTYNANPASFAAALEVLRGIRRPGKKILVVGDMLELGPRSQALHEEAGRLTASAGLDWLITVGPAARLLLQAAWNAGFPKAAGQSFLTPEEAGRFLSEIARAGDTVLLKGSRGMRMEKVLECSTTSSIR